MATVICPSYSGAAVLRATKLDSCCKPIFENLDNPGKSGQVTTDAFINIGVTPGGEGEGGGESEPISKADGRVCFQTSSCPQPQPYGVDIQLCALDPELVLIMKPTWCAVRDATGGVIGFTAGSTSGCDTSGFALEVWMSVYSGASSACQAAGGGATYGYLLLPCVTNVQIGGWTIQTGPITFSFSGTTRFSAGWGKGPYNVFMNNGKPQPLPCPVRQSASFTQFVTTFPPPEPSCGMEPVDGGLPEPPTVFIERSTNVSGCIVQLRADNHGYGNVMIDWGDSAITEARDQQIVTHAYGNCGDPRDAPAPYTIRVCDKQYPQMCTARTITAPLAADVPVIRCYQDPASDDGKTVLVDVTLPQQAWCGKPDDETIVCACPGESPIGYWGLKVDWGEDTGDDSVQYIAVGADCKATLRHTYSTDGIFPIKVCRNDVPKWCARCKYTAGGLRPNVTFISWDQTCGATIRVDNNRRGTVSVDWGDGSPLQTSVREGDITHAYTGGLGQSYLITVCSEAIGGGCRTLRTPVCTGAGQQLVTVVAACAPTDATGLTVNVTADNRGAGAVTITAPGATSIKDADDKPDVEQDAINAGDGKDITVIKYPADETGVHVITATDTDDPARTGTDSITLPCKPGLDATATCGADKQTVTVTVRNATFPITVDWDDGSVPVVYPQPGAIVHTYYKEGDPLDPARPAPAILGGPVTLSQTTVHQQAAIDVSTEDVYATQVINAGRQLAGETAPVSSAERKCNGDLALNRVDKAGKLLGHMYARKFDHGAGLGVQRDGANVWLWTGTYALRCSGGAEDGYAKQVGRFPFKDGTVIDLNTEGVEHFNPRPNGDHLTPSIDTEHEQIGIRYQQSGAYRITVWPLGEFLAKNYNNPTYDKPITVGQHFQCWTLYGRYVYTFYGYSYDDVPPPGEARFTVTDMQTGTTGPSIPNNQHPEVSYREPESIFVWPTPTGPRLVWGFGTGAGGARKMNLYATAAHRKEQPVSIKIRDAAGATGTATGVAAIPCSNVPPEPEKITVTQAKCLENRNRVAVTYKNPNNRGVRIYWFVGDTNPTTHTAATGTIQSPRDYSPGDYQIRVQDIDDVNINSALLEVNLPCGELEVSVQCDIPTDTSGKTVRLIILGSVGKVTVDWGDGTAQTPVDYPQAGLTHVYTVATPPVPTPYTVTVKDVNNPEAVTAQGSPITIPCSA